MAGSVIACKQNNNTTKPAAAPAGSMFTGATIVYVNQDTLLNKYDYVKDMTKRLQDRGSSVQSDLGSREQAIQREIADYQKAAATMSADQRSATEERLQRKGQEFQSYRQNATAQVQQEQLSEQTKLFDKVSDFMKSYAKEKGYKFILTYQHGNANMLYGDPSLDVTSDVIDRLNEAYAKEKK
jgi:outer membrane protein